MFEVEVDGRRIFVSFDGLVLVVVDTTFGALVIFGKSMSAP